MTPDLAWQLTALASLVVSVPLGLAARRALAQLDRRREHRQ